MNCRDHLEEIRRDFNRFQCIGCARAVALLLLTMVVLIPCDVYAEKASKKPNIVLIMADDLGLECLGCYGGTSYKTPRLDQLAATGLRFTHAYSQPLCTPTRVELMTGRENHRNWQCFGILPKGETTFGHVISKAGYKTCIAGKWQLTSYDPPDFPGAEKRRGTGTHPRDAGFDTYSLFHSEETEDKGSRYGNPTYLRDGTLHQKLEGEYGEDHAVEHILDFMKRNKDESMFVYYPMALPHWPMVPTPISEDWKKPELRLQESTDYFPDMVEYMDILIGRLVDSINDLGLREETIIIFYSDNGTDQRITSHMGTTAVQGGKAKPTQTGIRVPLIVNCPAKIKPSVSRDLIEASDFFPTLLELAQVENDKSLPLEGVSFAPQIRGEMGTQRESVFIWYDPRPGWDKERFSRHIFALDHKYKLFSDGRMYEISGTGFREELITTEQMTPRSTKAKQKLQAVIDKMMQPPLSSTAQQEVDAFGNPIRDE